MIDLTPSRLRILLDETRRLRAEERLMNLRTMNLAYNGGDAANAHARELQEQAGLLPARPTAFDVLLARARESAAARKRN